MAGKGPRDIDLMREDLENYISSNPTGISEAINGLPINAQKKQGLISNLNNLKNWNREELKSVIDAYNTIIPISERTGNSGSSSTFLQNNVSGTGQTSRSQQDIKSNREVEAFFGTVDNTSRDDVTKGLDAYDPAGGSITGDWPGWQVKIALAEYLEVDVERLDDYSRDPSKSLINMVMGMTKELADRKRRGILSTKGSQVKFNVNTGITTKAIVIVSNKGASDTNLGTGYLTVAKYVAILFDGMVRMFLDGRPIPLLAAVGVNMKTLGEWFPGDRDIVNVMYAIRGAHNHKSDFQGFNISIAVAFTIASSTRNARLGKVKSADGVVKHQDIEAAINYGFETGNSLFRKFSSKGAVIDDSIYKYLDVFMTNLRSGTQSISAEYEVKIKDSLRKRLSAMGTAGGVMM